MNGFFSPSLCDKWNTLFSYSTAQSFSPPLSLTHTHTHTHTHTPVFTSVPRSFSTVWNWIFNLVLWSVVCPLMAGCVYTYCIRKGSWPLAWHPVVVGWGVSCHNSFLLSLVSLSPPESLKHSHCHLFSLFLLYFLIPERHLPVTGE